MSATASSPALKSETAQFALDGSSYEIDLRAPDAAVVRDALAAFVVSASAAMPVVTGPPESVAAPSAEGWVEEVGAQLNSKLHRLIEIDPAIAETDPAALADQLVAAVPTRHDLDRLSGPFYDTAGLARWLGVTRQALDDRAKKGTLLMCPLVDGTRVYPAWQFRSDRTTVPHLVDTLKILRVGAKSSWTAATWLRTPSSAFDAVDAVTWLDHGGDPKVVLDIAREDADRWSR